MKKLIIIFVCTVLILTSLTGCSSIQHTSTTNYPFLKNTDSSYFICYHGENAGLVVYDSNGMVSAQFPNTTVLNIMTTDGCLLYPDIGTIPRDSFIFVENKITYARGLWDVAKEKWIFEPTNNLSYQYINGKILNIKKDDVYYDTDFSIIDDASSKQYFISDELQLQNIPENNFYYIADQTGNKIIDKDSFYSINQASNILLSKPFSIALADTVSNKYMIIEYCYSKTTLESNEKLEVCSYLCDLQGKILFPEWKYQHVYYANDQYQNANRDLLCFANYDTGEMHFFDLTNEEEIIFPMGYENITAMTDNLFLLSKGNFHTIYNKNTQQKGSQIQAETISNLYVFGINTYAVVDSLDKCIVIEDTSIAIDDIYDSIYVRQSPYPVIITGDITGEHSKSYILNASGDLITTVDDIVLYANEYCYCVVTGNSTSTIDIRGYE